MPESVSTLDGLTREQKVRGALRGQLYAVAIECAEDVMKQYPGLDRNTLLETLAGSMVLGNGALDEVKSTFRMYLHTLVPAALRKAGQHCLPEFEGVRSNG
jgi:hypothetical protein